MGIFKKDSAIAERFRRLPMRWKMSFSYAVPVILIAVLVIDFSFLFFQDRYRRQLEESVAQESRQSVQLIEAYLANMQYVLEQGMRSSEIRTILEETDFGSKETEADSFREFQRLDIAFSRLEVENQDVRLGLYLPGSIGYTNNRFHFYPLSDLENRSDYEAIMDALGAGRQYYLFLEETTYPGPAPLSTSYYSCLSLLTIPDGGGVKQFIMKAQIRESLLRSALEGATALEGDITLLLDRDGTVLTEDDEEAAALFMPDMISFLNVPDWTGVSLHGNEYYAVSDNFSGSDRRIVSFIPVSRFRAQYGFIFIILFLALFSLIVTIGAVSVQLSRYYAGRIARLNSRMIDVGEGAVNARVGADVEYGSRDELDELYRNFDFMTGEIRRLMKEEYQLGRNVTRAEMRALQAQINPHFLYNTLDLINWGAKDYGAENVAKIARDLGLYYRLSLNRGSSVISLGDELRHIEAFIRIENVHYDGAITLLIDVPDELRHYGFINTVLQPIVENSIVHGIAEHPDISSCRITIRAFSENEDLIVEAEDDGKGMDEQTAKEIVVYDPKAKGHGYGIANTNFRLKLCYGEEYGITYRRAVPHGTIARVRAKALYPEELARLIEGETQR